MGTRLVVFALLISLIVQSVLAIGCGADRLSAALGDDVTTVVAADVHDAPSLENYCSSCGGLRTAGGCCAHGLPLTAAAVALAQTSPVSGVSSLDSLPSPKRNPSSLFRPPITA